MRATKKKKPAREPNNRAQCMSLVPTNKFIVHSTLNMRTIAVTMSQ